MIKIHVLDNGELFKQVLNATSTFIYSGGFISILKVAVLFAIIFTTVKYIKTRDPSVFAYWFASYLIVTACVITPKTNVEIDDVSQQLEALKVDNVPVVFAIGVKLATVIGFGLGQAFDELMSMPDDLKYTKTGMLFGSHMMQAVNKVRVQDSELKAELSGYFRNCIVGDVRLLHKYTLHNLRNSTNIASTVFDNTSSLRRTILRDGQNLTCKDAAVVIQKALTKEIDDRTYKSLWARLIGKNISSKGDNKKSEPQPNANYKELVGNYVQLGAQEFQGLRDTSTNILRQTMLINAIEDGVRDYQSYTNSQSGLANYNFSKSQVQHRNAWAVMGKKAAWFLPLQHTILLLIMFGIFPIILVLSITPFGAKVFKEYAAFFLSLQLWPAIFAIINLAMTYYGKKHSLPYGGTSIANIDSVDQVHEDIAGIAGYAMFFIPSIAYGLLSRGIGNSMMHNANSMNSHTQGSTMGVASEIAGGNISVGQSSYMNTNANNLSLNKHDSNWTDLHGTSTQQFDSGMTATTAANGQTAYNSSQMISQGAFTITDTNGIQHSLSQASEKAMASANSHQLNYNDAVSHATTSMMQYGNGLNHDDRAGNGGSIAQSTSESQAMSRIIGIAHDVAERAGISQSDALSGLSNIALNGHAGIDGQNSLGGKALGKVFGFKGGVGISGSAGTSSNHTDNHQTGVDSVLSAKDFSDFKNDLQSVMSTTATKHFDENNSQNENLLSQIGSDLRLAQSESSAVNASLTDSNRISNTSSYVKSHSGNIAHNLTQEAVAYGESLTSKEHMIDLMGSPGDSAKNAELQGIYQGFLDTKAQNLVKEHGDFITQKDVLAHHNQGMQVVHQSAEKIESNYQSDRARIGSHQSEFKDVHTEKAALESNVNSVINSNRSALQHEKHQAELKVEKIQKGAQIKTHKGEVLAKRSPISGFGHSIKKDFNGITNQIKNYKDK